MAITVQAIENKEFKTKRLNGYDPEDVDLFLDEICDHMIAMQEEMDRLHAQLAMQQAAPAPVPAPYFAPQPEPVPVPPPFVEEKKPDQDSAEAAQKLLLRAQKVYDETVADARREAEKILSGARAQNDLGAMTAEKAALQEEIDMLRAAARDYRNRFLRLVEDQRHVLASEKALFDAE